MLLEVKQLTKSFGGLMALNNVSFSIEEGEVVGLIGPNGAGKTTTLKTTLGLLRPTKGEISFMGQSITQTPTHDIVNCRSNEHRQFSSNHLRGSVYPGCLDFARRPDGAVGSGI